MDSRSFDLIILGGGHAGCEAAHIAAQFGISVGLISMPGVGLASCPCNPAVGGVGKGQVVRELDMLGGLIGKLADLAGIQYRTLNESKGFAVRSTRVQVDKEKYSKFAEELLGNIENLNIIRAKVDKITRENDCFVLFDSNKNKYIAKKLIVTTGTFLNGKLHSGEKQVVGGRVNCASSKGLADLFDEVKTLPARFKTGTPARLNIDSIDFSNMSEQASDCTAKNFHWENIGRDRNLRQVSCYITHTNKQTLDEIRRNKDRSPMYNGQIKGLGPRYCPSIEDKAFRYPDRDVHHVFIEPEGLDLETVYPNGISTSLPHDVQTRFIRSIAGLERAQVEVFGYAVEYDVVDTAHLSFSLEHKKIKGLFFAGQVNGTSGYEEAAGQGFVAGANAALSLIGSGPFALSRADSYIGVMIEDLVTQKRDEPYRLFTARSENRLYMREDNTFLRMYSYRKSFKLNLPIDKWLASIVGEYDALKALVEALRLGETLKLASVNAISVLRGTLEKANISFSDQVIESVAIEAIYDGYIKRSERQFEKVLKAESAKININQLLSSSNLSFECKERIREYQPLTFGQLKRIEGIRPASLAFIASQL